MRTNSEALAEWAAQNAASGPTPDSQTSPEKADTRPTGRTADSTALLPPFHDHARAVQSQIELDREDVQYIATVLAMAVTVAQAFNGSG